MEATIEVYNRIRNDHISVETTELMLKRLQKHTDTGVLRSFVDGHVMRDVVKTAPVLKVGLSFLDGSNTARVNRVEQTDMMNREPEQMSAEWRVNTAQQLLSEFEVNQDLSIRARDRTKEAARRARTRISERRRPLLSNRSSTQELVRQTNTDDITDAYVTIDSDQVVLVHELYQHVGKFDIESTLVEVDGPSLLKLIVSYKCLTERVGQSPNFEETRDILETMMEDVRRLCNRSPVLFRMSTRDRIIMSKNTRYGTNHGRQFTTITTSRGIQEIIGHSAAYFNSLDADPQAQKFIRPRFLQMLVVLLSLLNDDDLIELREFLEHTYRFKADRASLELLILKVIPMSSINPKVFVTSLVPAFEGYTPGVRLHSTFGFKHYWDTFIQKIAKRGYMLPGTVENLGRDTLSWVVDWPELGFKDSSVFEHLQYSGELRTFNQIPRFENLQYPEKGGTKLTVVLTNNQKYIIRAVDYGSIILLNPGGYSIQDAGPNGRLSDLDIQEIWLNKAMKDATADMNHMIRQINAHVAPTAIKRSESRFGLGLTIRSRRGPDIARMGECTYSGRLTKHIATIGRDILAVAYKREGQKITLSDAVSLMKQDKRELEGLIKYYSERLQAHANKFDATSRQSATDKLTLIQSHINEAEAMREQIREYEYLSDEPISKVLVSAGDRTHPSNVWYSYKALPADNGHVSIQGIRASIREVRWFSDRSIVEATLESEEPTISESKFFVSPLEEVEPGNEGDQLRPGDRAILCGQFMVIAELDQSSSRGLERLFCTNFLKITSVEKPSQSARGKRRQATAEGRSQPVGGSVTVLS